MKRHCKCAYCRHCRTSHNKYGQCQMPGCRCEVFI